MSHDFEQLTDLAGARLGGAVLWASDELFAGRENLLREEEPVFDPDAYTDRGKLMDGWESSRQRPPYRGPADDPRDRCLVRLGVPGVVRGVVVDTRHFVGNHPAACSLDGVDLTPPATAGPPGVDALLADDVPWRPLVERSELRGDHPNPFPVRDDGRVSHLRLTIHPDGGVARLRVYGEPRPDWEELARRGETDLTAARHGGRVLAASDGFFGRPDHLLLPGPPRGMHDGWETRRRRGPGHDWVVLRLARPGTVGRLEIDTTWFKGNAPESCRVEGCAPGAWPQDTDPAEAPWEPVLPRTPLQPHTRHQLRLPRPVGPLSHLRLSIHPDGGVARLRAFGTWDRNTEETP